MKIKLKHQAVLANKKDFLSPSDREGDNGGTEFTGELFLSLQFSPVTY